MLNKYFEKKLARIVGETNLKGGKTLLDVTGVKKRGIKFNMQEFKMYKNRMKMEGCEVALTSPITKETNEKSDI